LAAKLSAIAVIGAGCVLRKQSGGLLTVTASSSRTATSCISELTFPARQFKRGPASLATSEGDLESQLVADDAIVGAIAQLADDVCSAGDAA